MDCNCANKLHSPNEEKIFNLRKSLYSTNKHQFPLPFVCDQKEHQLVQHVFPIINSYLVRDLSNLCMEYIRTTKKECDLIWKFIQSNLAHVDLRHFLISNHYDLYTIDADGNIQRLWLKKEYCLYAFLALYIILSTFYSGFNIFSLKNILSIEQQMDILSFHPEIIMMDDDY